MPTAMLTTFLATFLPVQSIRALVAPMTVEISGWAVGAPLAVLLLTAAGIEIGAAWLMRADREVGHTVRDRD